MPWFARIAIVAIVMFTLAQLVSMATGRHHAESEAR